MKRFTIRKKTKNKQKNKTKASLIMPLNFTGFYKQTSTIDETINCKAISTFWNNDNKTGDCLKNTRHLQR